METAESLGRPATKTKTSRLGEKFARAIFFLAGLSHLLTAAAMLFAPTWFYEHIGTFPPYNRHYTGDLGAFQVPLGLGLLLAARDPRRYSAMVWVALAGNVLHMLNHTYDALVEGASFGRWLGDVAPLYAVALLLLVGLALATGRPGRA